jgi:hypothetical protein
MKGVLLLLVRFRARHASTQDFYPAFAAVVKPVQNILFLTVHYFKFCVPIAQQPGQTVVQGRLSLNVCLRLRMGKDNQSGEQDRSPLYRPFESDLYVYSLLDYSILVDIVNLIQHRTHRITVPLLSTPLNYSLNSGYTHRAK